MAHPPFSDVMVDPMAELRPRVLGPPGIRAPNDDIRLSSSLGESRTDALAPAGYPNPVSCPRPALVRGVAYLPSFSCSGRSASRCSAPRLSFWRCIPYLAARNLGAVQPTKSTRRLWLGISIVGDRGYCRHLPGGTGLLRQLAEFRSRQGEFDIGFSFSSVPRRCGRRIASAMSWLVLGIRFRDFALHAAIESSSGAVSSLAGSVCA
jgi:hypothetical protein